MTSKRLLTREEALELYFSLPDDPTSSDADRDTDEDFAPELAPPDSDEQSSEAEAAESTRKPQKRKATYSRKKRRQKKVPRICDEAEVEEEEVGAWNSSEPDAVIRVPKIWYPQYSANFPTTPCEAFALYFDEGIMNTLVYEGKGADRPANVGLGEHVVLSLIDRVEAGTQLYFDNFFTSTRLMEALKEKNILAAGTVRPNRKDLPDEIKRDNKLQKGQYIWRAKGSITSYQWRDTKNVHVLSNFHHPSDTEDVVRKLSNGSSISVQCPKAVSD
ncbi:hypothetical protein HPB51_008929 [Rhipicephalus microplus]|uniref:PiggyBac transposable element-derived protein domain-containing protein n=1 Tax=Rhipicephalus microplus TaxID=6941 RepID=A0A9J6E8Y1_RHIMP|nr:hypothetical protein HPB51_008929 [Rhipicephalus microplus]